MKEDRGRGVKKDFPEVKILIMDQDDASYRMLGNVLRSMGYLRIERSKSTPHSLRMIKYEKYDLFFVSYRPHGTDGGVAFVEHLSAGDLREKGLIFLLFNDKEKYPSDFPPEYQADGILRRPYTPSKLLSLIHEASSNRLIHLKTLELLKAQNAGEALALNTQFTGSARNKVFGTLVLGEIYEGNNRTQEAETLYRSYLRHFPHCAVVWDKVGLLIKEQGRPIETEFAFLSAIQKNPYYLPARIHLAEFYSRKGAVEKARDVLRSALKLHPSNTALNKDFAQVSLQLKDHQAAEAAFKNALRDGGYAKDPTLLIKYGHALMLNGKREEALQNYNRSLEQGKSETDTNKRGVIMKEALMAKGRCYLSYHDPKKTQLAKGCFKGAERTLKKIKVAPEARDVLSLSVGRSYLEHEMEEDAGKVFSEYIESNPDDKSRQGSVLDIYKFFNKLKKGVEVIENALRKSMKIMEAPHDENRRLKKEDKYQETVKKYHRLIKRSPSDAWLYFNCGRTCLEWAQYSGYFTEEGKMKKAIAFTHFRSALRLNPGRIAKGLQALGVDGKEVESFGAPDVTNPVRNRSPLKGILEEK